MYSANSFSVYPYCITKHSSALYIGMAKVLPIIDVLGYDGQNSSFSSSSSSSPPPPYIYIYIYIYISFLGDAIP